MISFEASEEELSFLLLKHGDLISVVSPDDYLFVAFVDKDLLGKTDDIDCLHC